MPASSDGFVTVTAIPAWASVGIVIDWKTSSPMPWQTTVLRTNPDGTVVTVRSGDLAYTPGGDGYVYDHEAPLEGTLKYQAFGYLYDGTLVQTSTQATIVLTATVTMWLKSVTNPSRSMSLSMTDQQEAWPQAQQAFHIPGRANPVVWQDVQGGITGSATFETMAQSDHNGLRLLAGSGVLLLQGSVATAAFDHDTYLVPSGLKVKRNPLIVGWALREFSFDYVEVDRPSTTGSVLKVPAWTNDVVAATYATFTAWDAAFPTTYVNQAKGP